MLLIGIISGDPRDVAQPVIELAGNEIGFVQRAEEIVRRQDKLDLEATDAVADVEHAFTQGHVGRFLAVENGVEVMPVHYAPVTDKCVKTVIDATT